MKRSIYTIFFAAIASIALTGLQNNNSLMASETTKNLNITKASMQADSILKTLTLRERIAQLFILAYQIPEGEKKQKLQNQIVKNENIGGVIIMNSPLLPAIERLNRFHAMAKTPLLVTIDGEWGISMRFDEVPVFPRQMQLGALSSDTLVYKVGRAIGEECNKLNIHVNFAPDIDINNNNENPAINTRSFGENKRKVAEYGIAYSRGMRSRNVSGSAKHFPGHGDTDIDSHKSLPQLKFTRERLDSLELYPFKKLIADNIEMVMVGHLDVPALDKGNRPSSISKSVITDLLRDELGFNGIICTDALNMDGVAKMSGYEKSRIPLEAYKAGADILLMPDEIEKSITMIENAVKSGKLSEDDLNRRVGKILNLKAEKGLFEKGYKPYVNTYKLAERFENKENMNLVREIAEKSMTLLTNFDTILPLKNLSDTKVGIVAIGKSEINDLFNRYAQFYVNAKYVSLKPDVSVGSLDSTKKVMKDRDLIIFALNNTDNRPYKNFGIDTAQYRFITQWVCSQPAIAAYMGSPYAFGKIDNVKSFKAFLVGYLSNEHNNLAAVETIFGGVPAAGVLPVSTGDMKEGESVILNDCYRERYPYYGLELPDGLDSLTTFKDIGRALAILPLMSDLIDKDSIRLTSSLGDIITPDNKTNGHNRLLLWDLLCHRGGLPETGDYELLNADNVNSLQLIESVEPTFSNANIFYLNRILERYYNNPMKSGMTTMNQAFKMIEMSDSRIDADGTFTTTSNDLRRLRFAINNNGCYAGKQALSQQTAKLLNMIWQYYKFD